MVRFFAVFFLWICNKRGDFLSPCFPLDLVYRNRNFVSQNWHRKFVNRWKFHPLQSHNSSTHCRQQRGRQRTRKGSQLLVRTSPAASEHAGPAIPVRAAALHEQQVALKFSRLPVTRRWWLCVGDVLETG